MASSSYLEAYFIFMPIQFECEEEWSKRLSINVNGLLLDFTIHDYDCEESLYVMIDYQNAEILINEIRKKVNEIKKNLKN